MDMRLAGTTILVAASAILAFGAAPEDLAAQTYWRIPSTIGGAFVGAGAGYALDIAAWGGGGADLAGPNLTMTPVGIGIGALAGFLGGMSADRRLARGDTLGRGNRVIMRSAMFLTPVAATSALAFAIINGSDAGRCVPYTGPDPNVVCTYEPPPRKFASDETVALVAIGSGVVAGWLAQRRFARALRPRARVGVAPNGRGLMISVQTR